MVRDHLARLRERRTLCVVFIDRTMHASNLERHEVVGLLV